MSTRITLRLSLLGTLLAALVMANPLTITVTGTASGSLGIYPFTSAQFTFTLTSDTALLTKPPCCNSIDTPSGTPTTFSITGAGSGKFTDNQAVFVLPGVIGFAHFNDGDLVDLNNAALNTYNLTTSIGPLTGAPSFVGTSAFSTDSGPLTFTSVSTVTFTVVVSTAPPVVTPAITAITMPVGTGLRLAPGTPMLITGSNLGVGPTDVATLSIGGKPAPLITFNSASSLLAQVPVDAAPGATTVVVTYKGQSSTAFPVTVDAFSPAIYETPGCTDGNGNPFTAARPAIASNIVTCTAVGLGATNPPMVTGVKANVQAPTTTPVQVMVGGKLVQPDYAGALVGSATDYRVTFKLPADVSVGPQSLFITIAGKQSNSVTLNIGAPTPLINGVVNGASFAGNAAAPNSFVSIFGANFGTKDTDANISPAIDFNGLSVLFNGAAAPLYFVFGSLGQINLVLPSELPETGIVSVQVKTLQGTSASFALSMAPADVGIFRIPDPSNAKRNNGAVLLANTAWRVMPASMAAALGFPSCNPATLAAACGQPAKPGDAIQIYLTGLGRATPNGDPTGQPLATGTLAPANGNPLYQTVQKPSVSIGGIPVGVAFSGIAPGNAGLYQVNVTIPDAIAAGDDVPVVVSMSNGSKDTVTIAIR